MKWFTIEVYSGIDSDGNELADESFLQASRAYEEHLASIDDRLSPGVRALSKVNFHDAVPHKVKATFPKSLALGFELRGQARGPVRRPLDITYRRWDVGPGLGVQSLEILMEWGGESLAVLNDEVDIASDGRYIHRLLFWPAGELSIFFAELSIGPLTQP